MFRLFYFFKQSTPSLVFTDNDLGPCLDFIKSKSLVARFCVIVAPNNRRITFDNNNQLVFSSAA